MQSNLNDFPPLYSLSMFLYVLKILKKLSYYSHVYVVIGNADKIKNKYQY